MSSHYPRLLFTLLVLLAVSLAVLLAAPISADSHGEDRDSGSQGASDPEPSCPSCIEPPPAPTGLTVTPNGQNSIRVSWNSRTGFAKYRLDYKRSSSSIWTVATLNITSPSYTVSNLQCNTLYNFKVKAYGDGDDYTGSWGAWSSTRSTSTSTCPTAPAPTGLTTTRSTLNSISLRWNSVTNAYRYKLERREGASGSWQTVSSNISGTTQTATGLTCDTTYYFRVSARGDGSPLSTTFGSTSTGTVSRRTGTCPSAPAPTGLITTASTQSSVSLRWNPVTDAYRYKLERREGASGSWQTVSSTISGTTQTAYGLTCNTTYYFRVSARGDGSPYSTTFGNTSSLASRSTSTCDDAPPPGGLTTTGSTLNSVSLRWNPVTNAYRYKLERREDTSGSWQTVNSNISGTTQTAYGLTCDTTYYFRVSARGDGSPLSTTFGNASSLASRSTSICDDAPAPSGLTTTGSTRDSVSLRWNSVTNAYRYQLERREGTSGSWRTVRSNISGTTQTAYGLECDTTYYFRVSARGDGSPFSTSFGNPSASVSRDTDLCLPPAPTGVTVMTTATTALASWDAQSGGGISSYLVDHDEVGSEGASGAGGGPSQGVNTFKLISGLVPGTNYDFKVRAVGDGVTYAAEQGPWSGTVREATQPPDEAPAPTGLRATGSTRDSISLSWNSVTDAYRYKLERSPDGTSGWTDADSGADNITVTSYTVTGLTCNTTYYFRVRAKGNGNPYSTSFGDPSSSSPPKDTDLCLPPAPSGFDATPAGNSVDLSWHYRSGISKYRIQHRLSTASTWPAASTTVTGTSHTVSDLSYNTGYDFRIAAFGDGSTFAAQWGSYSSDSVATKPRVNVSEPTGLAVEMTGSSTSHQSCSAKFTWDVPTGAVAYEYEAALVGNEGASRRNPTEPPHGPENEHVFDGLWCSTEYDFRVKARGNGSDIWKGEEQDVIYTTEWSGWATYRATTKPYTPTTLITPTLTATANNGRVDLSWTIVSGSGITYEVKQLWESIEQVLPHTPEAAPYDDPLGDRYTLTTPVVGTTHVTATVDGWLKEGSTYRYTVRAVQGNKASKWSNVEVVMLPQCVSIAPPGSSVPVCDLASPRAELKRYRAANLWDGEIDFRWNPLSSGNPSYRIQMQIGGVWQTLPFQDYAIAYGTNAATVSQLPPGHIYSFRLLAYTDTTLRESEVINVPTPFRIPVAGHQHDFTVEYRLDTTSLPAAPVGPLFTDAIPFAERAWNRATQSLPTGPRILFCSATDCYVCGESGSDNCNYDNVVADIRFINGEVNGQGHTTGSPENCGAAAACAHVTRPNDGLLHNRHITDVTIYFEEPAWEYSKDLLIHFRLLWTNDFNMRNQQVDRESNRFEFYRYLRGVVMHEFGHAAGLEDLDKWPGRFPGYLMTHSDFFKVPPQDTYYIREAYRNADHGSRPH